MTKMAKIFESFVLHPCYLRSNQPLGKLLGWRDILGFVSAIDLPKIGATLLHTDLMSTLFIQDYSCLPHCIEFILW